jgi:hypothetical protein
MDKKIASLVENGLATPTSAFREIVDCTNCNGVPPIKSKNMWFINTSTSVEINTPFEVFQTHIQSVLSSIEGVRCEYDPANCVWNIEYGTRHIEYSKSGLEFRQIMTGKRVIMEAAQVAVERFPQLHNDYVWDDDDHFNPIYNNSPGYWSKMVLNVYTDTQKKCLFIVFNRISGDRETSWFIWNEIKRYFTENAIYLSRIPYIKAVEEIAVFDRENPILRYFADCMVVREICTYIPYK